MSTQRILRSTSPTLTMALLIAAMAAQTVAQLVPGAATKGGPRGAGAGAPPPLGITPKPAIPNTKPVRTCESLAMFTLPNTTIESATVDANNNSSVCRVTAITTHPPSNDKVKIWVAIPMTNWNGRFLGAGG